MWRRGATAVTVARADSRFFSFGNANPRRMKAPGARADLPGGCSGSGKRLGVLSSSLRIVKDDPQSVPLSDDATRLGRTSPHSCSCTIARETTTAFIRTCTGSTGSRSRSSSCRQRREVEQAAGLRNRPSWGEAKPVIAIPRPFSRCSLSRRSFSKSLGHESDRQT